MNYVFVLSATDKPLMPCHPARARELLNKKKAKVIRKYPFTIKLLNRKTGMKQPLEIKIDPGSKTTGLALVSHNKTCKKVIFGANLNHRGHTINLLLQKRAAVRRSRRNRKTRYRQARFLNRTRSKKEGWLAPSVQSRIDNIIVWITRFNKYSPLKTISLENVKFDTQKLQNPEIKGIEYQHGTLFGYEVKQYLLEKFNYQCVYCFKKDIPLEIEHIIPKSKGGSNRISNLTIACTSCNQKKGSQGISVFLKNKPELLVKINNQLKCSLKDAAIMNSIRNKLIRELKKFNLTMLYGSGAQTKYNRVNQNYVKDHWIDAACIGVTGTKVKIPYNRKPLIITKERRNKRQMCLMNKYGFPRSGPKVSSAFGFKSGDMVKAVVTKGKKIGTYIGKVAICKNGGFDIKTENGVTKGICYKYCKNIYKFDGYSYK